MSYTPPHSGDSMRDLFTRLLDFYKLLPNLIRAQEKGDEYSFIIWFEKLLLIDRRSVYLNVLNGKIKVPEEISWYAYHRLRGLNREEELKKVLWIEQESS